MKSALIKDSLRRIRNTVGRFFAIMAIVAIGCGFFAGVKVTSPDMKKTADKYYSDQNLMDIRLISTFGFSNDEIEKLSAEYEDIRDISGGFTADMFIKMDDGTTPVTKVWSYNKESKINIPTVEEGHLPEAANECLIESKTPEEYKIGDTITLMQDDDTSDNVLKNDTFKIVGIVSWVKYTDFERGTTTIGNGSIGSYIIIPEEAFAYDYYTDVYITLKSTENMYSFSDEYQELIDEKMNELELLAGEIHEKRLSETEQELADSEKELADSEKEYNDALETFNSEISDAETKISDAKAQIADKVAEIENGRKQYDDGMTAYNSGVSELAVKKAELQQKQREIDASVNDVNTLRQLQSSLNAFISDYAEIAAESDDTALIQLTGSLRPLDTAEFSVSSTALGYALLSPDDPQKAVLGETLAQAAAGITGQISSAESQIYTAQTELNNASAQVSAVESQLNASYRQLVDSKTLLDESEAQIADARSEIEASETELEEKRTEGEKELKTAEDELADGKKELEAAKSDYYSFVENLKWYVLDRNSDSGYSSFEGNADRVDSIARVFPVFFIIVAALVCFNTMTRMVEEQRTEIGTLKALGYGNGAIISQFMFYAASASIIGAVGGLVIGFNLFPRVIFQAYTLMYDYPDVICEFRWSYAVGCIIAALMCTCLSSIIACRRELTVQPAQLMRPKPPKSGKRVFLEHIPILWNHMSFNLKVTARNIFRYKNRVLMTVIGIGGCTALMLAGFGLKYAISVIVDLQFGEIFRYDAVCTFSADDDEEYDSLYDNIDSSNSISEYLFGLQKSITVKCGNESREAYAIVPENPEQLNDFITLRDRKNKDSCYTLSDEGVIINEKLAKLLSAETGDTLSFSDTDGTVLISAITENYSQNYVYFTPEAYEKVFGEYDNNIFYLNIADGCGNDTVSEEILGNEQVMSINFMEFAGNNFRTLVKSLNAIVFVIIASSGALAFVVLYNLSNINITERMRELATIKVLGFYDGEVASYIYRENTVSSILGMLLGLFGGIFLTKFVIQTAEVDVVMFCHDIPFSCFIYAAALTLLFTAAVNALLYFKLKKIDMAGSMKAIE